MGTTKQTQQSAQFDPTSMGTFQGLQGGLGDFLKGYMNNPFGNPFFQTQQQLGTRQAQNLGGTGMSNIARNITASGMGGGNMSPAALEMLQNQGRANTGLQAGLGFLSPVQNAQQMQQFAGGLASQYRPLQTGQHQTESTSGLGTWLPQLASGAMGLAGMIGTGGASAALPGGFFGGLSQHPFAGSSIPGGYGMPSDSSGMAGAMPSWMGGGMTPGLFSIPGGGGGMAPPPFPGGGS